MSEQMRSVDLDSGLLAAFDEHLQQVGGLQPRTSQGMLLQARRVLGWHREHRPGERLSDLTRSDVLDLACHTSAACATNRTRSVATSYTRSFLRYLQWAEIIVTDRQHPRGWATPRDRDSVRPIRSGL